jgi:hypothetical protein
VGAKICPLLKKPFFRLIRVLRSSRDASDHFVAGFVQGIDFEFEEPGISKAIGLTLQDADLGVGRDFSRVKRLSVAVRAFGLFVDTLRVR